MHAILITSSECLDKIHMLQIPYLKSWPGVVKILCPATVHYEGTSTLNQMVNDQSTQAGKISRASSSLIIGNDTQYVRRLSSVSERQHHFSVDREYARCLWFRNP